MSEVQKSFFMLYPYGKDADQKLLEVLLQDGESLLRGNSPIDMVRLYSFLYATKFVREKISFYSELEKRLEPYLPALKLLESLYHRISTIDFIPYPIVSTDPEWRLSALTIHLPQTAKIEVYYYIVPEGKIYVSYNGKTCRIVLNIPTGRVLEGYNSFVSNDLFQLADFINYGIVE